MVPDPPATSLNVNVQSLEKGVELHRLHRREFRGAQFNPCKGDPTRFAPIHHQNGKCIPSLYAAETLKAAIYETLFHDIDPKSRLRTIRESVVQERAYSVVTTRKTLQLVRLFTPDLGKLGLRRDELFSASANHFERTARWAKRIHDDVTTAHGMVWTSNRCDPNMAMVFFGDRVREKDFDVLETQDGSDDVLLEEVRAAGQTGGITVTV